MTDQIDIYVKISLYFCLYQKHIQRIKLSSYSKTIVKLKEKAIVKNVQLKIKC